MHCISIASVFPIVGTPGTVLSEVRKEANLEAMASHSGIYQKNSSIWRDGKKLSDEELSAMKNFDFDLYSKGRHKAKVGTALVSIGAVPCAIGVAGIIDTISEGVRIDRERKQGREPIPLDGLAQMSMLIGLGTGILFEAIGIPKLCSGRADIRHAAVGCNEQKRMQYSIGPTANGVGIALNF